MFFQSEKLLNLSRTPINTLSQGLKNNIVKKDESQHWYPKFLIQFILLYYCFIKIYYSKFIGY